MKSTKLARHVVLVVFFAPWLLLAQTAQQQNPPETAQAKPRLGQAGSQQELDAYNREHNEVNLAAKKDLIDDFVQRYPNSGLLAYVYQDGVYLGRQANNIDMMAMYGEKSLEYWPDNYTLLSELASAYVQRNRVDEAETMAKRALDLVATAERPSYMTDSQWADGKNVLISRNESTLGYVHLRRAQAGTDAATRQGEAENAITYFKTALSLKPLDDFAFYGLGFAYAILNDYPNAESNFARALALNGIVAANARGFLELIYRSQHGQSLIGLDKVIAKAKADLGIS